MSSRLNMQFAHIEVLCLFSKELCGAISKTMFISELDSELYGLGAFIVFMIVVSVMCKSSLWNSFGLGGMLFLGWMTWLSNICWRSWPVVINPRQRRSYSWETFFKLSRWFIFYWLSFFFSPLSLIGKLRTPFIKGKLGFSITLKGLRSLRYRKQENPDRKMPLCRNLKLGIINSSLKSLFLYA